MSYILEALKKSEEERHQGQVPNLGSGSTLIYNRHSKTTIWPWLIAALLLLNFSAIAFWLFNNQEEDTTFVEGGIVESQTTTPSRQLSTQTATESAEQIRVRESQLATTYESLPDNNALISRVERTVVAVPFSEQKNDHISADMQDVELSKADDGDVSAPTDIDVESREPLLITPKSGARKYTGPGYEDNHRSMQAASASEPVQERQSESRETAAATNSSAIVIPHLSDMPEGFQKRIPDMAFNSHIYTNAPDFRRVMINNIYLREKQSFSGLVVEQITEQGIVLSLDGKSFRMGVLRDWHSPR